jgi:hypothetical protein
MSRVKGLGAGKRLFTSMSSERPFKSKTMPKFIKEMFLKRDQLKQVNEVGK